MTGYSADIFANFVEALHRDDPRRPAVLRDLLAEGSALSRER